MKCDLVMTCINSMCFHVPFAFQENFSVFVLHGLENPCQDQCKQELVAWLYRQGARKAAYKRGSNAWEATQGQGLIT